MTSEHSELHEWNSFESFLDWFDIRRYSHSRAYGAREWLYALSSRTRLSESESDFEELYNVVGFGALEYRQGKNETRNSTVQEISLAEAWEFRDVIQNDPTGLELCLEFERESDKSEDMGWEEASESERTELFARILEKEREKRSRKNAVNVSFSDVSRQLFGDCIFVGVDVSSPDDLLVDDFKSWLKQARSQKTQVNHSPVKRFSPKELARWHQNGVLPYIDIQLAAKFFGVAVTHHKIASLLFSNLDEIDTAEKVRKGVVPLVQEILSDEMMGALEWQARAHKGLP